jgi:NAD+ synthase (glutamine-hydrolysing)
MPRVEIASPEFNTSQMLQLAGQAASADAVLVVFPELGISAYSNEDLFLQDALLDAVEAGLDRLLDVSRELSLILVVGAPLRSESRLFNCAVVIYRGSILGVIPRYPQIISSRSGSSRGPRLSREPFVY